MTTDTTLNKPGKIHVALWTDFICPWCGIGERNFLDALQAFSHSKEADIAIRSFRLRPDSVPTLVQEVLREKRALLPDEIAAAIDRLEKLGTEAGLPYRLAGSWSCDTMDGHRLVKLAQKTQQDTTLFRRLFRAAMCEEQAIHDPDVLRVLAREVGLDPASVDDVLNGDQYRDAVLADEEVMREHGGRGIPFFVLNGCLSYSGALSTDIFLSALNKAWNSNTASTDCEQQKDAATLCGPDGCALPGN